MFLFLVGLLPFKFADPLLGCFNRMSKCSRIDLRFRSDRANDQEITNSAIKCSPAASSSTWSQFTQLGVLHGATVRIWKTILKLLQLFDHVEHRHALPCLQLVQLDFHIWKEGNLLSEIITSML